VLSSGQHSAYFRRISLLISVKVKALGDWDKLQASAGGQETRSEHDSMAQESSEPEARVAEASSQPYRKEERRAQL